MKKCFCEDLTDLKEIGKMFKLPDGIKRRYTVAIVEYDYKGRDKKGSITHYNYYRYKLNFCPECGRILNRKEKHELNKKII